MPKWHRNHRSETPRLCGLDKAYVTVSLELGVQMESPFAPDFCSKESSMFPGATHILFFLNNRYAV